MPRPLLSSTARKPCDVAMVRSRVEMPICSSTRSHSGSDHAVFWAFAGDLSLFRTSHIRAFMSLHGMCAFFWGFLRLHSHRNHTDATRVVTAQWGCSHASTTADRLRRE
jgi:hypothetical protein